MNFSADYTGKLVGICSSLFLPHDDLVKIKMFHYNQETLKQARKKEAEGKRGKKWRTGEVLQWRLDIHREMCGLSVGYSVGSVIRRREWCIIIQRVKPTERRWEVNQMMEEPMIPLLPSTTAPKSTPVKPWKNLELRNEESTAAGAGLPISITTANTVPHLLLNQSMAGGQVSSLQWFVENSGTCTGWGDHTMLFQILCFVRPTVQTQTFSFKWHKAEKCIIHCTIKKLTLLKKRKVSQNNQVK